MHAKNGEKRKRRFLIAPPPLRTANWMVSQMRIQVKTAWKKREKTLSSDFNRLAHPFKL